MERSATGQDGSGEPRHTQLVARRVGDAVLAGMIIAFIVASVVSAVR